jgi:uroporphyrinogen III methyltransferase / synthase
MKPLSGIKILVTRDLHQAVGMKNRLNELGAEVECVPTIKIVDPPKWDIFDTAVVHLDAFAWLVFSSTNAVHQSMKRLTELNLNIKPDSKTKVAAVGSQTAAVLESYGMSVDLIPDLFQAEALVNGLLEIGVQNQNILIPRALEGRSFLESQLEEAGAIVTVAPVYQNVIPSENKPLLEQLIKTQTIDWITFTSSSTATNFVKLLGDSIRAVGMPKIASIGSITTRTLENCGLLPNLTAHPQNVDGIVNCIVKWETDSRIERSNDG